MELNEFKKIEKEVTRTNFHKNYRGTRNILASLAVLGNFGSIFCASFFLFKILDTSFFGQSLILVDWPLWTITLIILGGLELIKRDIFHKFTSEFLKVNTLWKKSVKPLLAASAVLLVFSFYSSLSGARELASMQDVVQEENKVTYEIVEDSLKTKVYGPLITEQREYISEQRDYIVELRSDNKTYDEKILSLPDNYISEKKRWRDEKRANEKLIDDAENKINEAEVKIVEIEDKLEKALNKERNLLKKEETEIVSETKENVAIFIAISTIIELLILIGIYFANLYKIRSYEEMNYLINNDPNHMKWKTYTEILEMLFEIAIGKTVPDYKTLKDYSDIHNTGHTDDELRNAYQLFTALKIIKNGDNKTFSADLPGSMMIIKEHFKID